VARRILFSIIKNSGRGISNVNLVVGISDRQNVRIKDTNVNMDKTKRQNVGIIDKVNKTTLAEATGKGGAEVAAGIPEAG
jgi:hypothetical protein